MISALRVQILGPKGGERHRRTFKGWALRELTTALSWIMEEEEGRRRSIKRAIDLLEREDARNPVEKYVPIRKPCKLGPPDPADHHDLRPSLLKSGMRRWTCRRCKRQIDVTPEFNSFQASLSLVFDIAMNDGRSWVKGEVRPTP